MKTDHKGTCGCCGASIPIEVDGEAITVGKCPNCPLFGLHAIPQDVRDRLLEQHYMALLNEPVVA